MYAIYMSNFINHGEHPTAPFSPVQEQNSVPKRLEVAFSALKTGVINDNNIRS